MYPDEQFVPVQDATTVSVLDRSILQISAAVERAQAGDSGAPFEEDTISALRHVREEAPAEYMRLRTALKKSNRDLRITELDAVVDKDVSEADRQTADLLADMAQQRCTLFHDTDGQPYATFCSGGHRECWPIKSQGFIEWLSYEFYRSERRAPAETAVKTALGTLSGHAKFAGEQKLVAVRVANLGGSILIDLCNEAWQAIEVTLSGWRLLDESPVMFVRSSTMRSLPTPQAGGDLSLLWAVTNIPVDDRLILLAWMLECYRPHTPYAVLEFVGEQGAAKSSTQNYIRELIDPNQSNNRAAPKNVEDVYVTARNAHLVSFQNLSHLGALYQDALCVLATGGGFATRTYYTNLDETVLELKKPVVLNGIAVVVTAQDLVDRTVHIDLPTIEDG